MGYENLGTHEANTIVVNSRLYFMSGHNQAKLDPRDVPRIEQTSLPLPRYEVKEIRKDEIVRALAASFVEAYATGDFSSAFPEGATVTTDKPTNEVPAVNKPLFEFAVAA